MDKMMCAFLVLGLISGLMAQMLSGRRLYNSDSEMCCDGAVYKQSGGNTSCCGQTPYDPDVNACCWDTLHELPPEIRRLGHYGCCYDNDGHFKSLYDDEKKLCCDGVLYPRPKGRGAAGCCNGKPFDPDKSTCHGLMTLNSNNVVAVSTHNVQVSSGRRHGYLRSARAASFLCPGGGDVFGNGRSGKKMPCCLLAHKLYDPQDQACCYNQVIDITEDDRRAKWDTCCLRFPFTAVAPETDF